MSALQKHPTVLRTGESYVGMTHCYRDEWGVNVSSEQAFIIVAKPSLGDPEPPFRVAAVGPWEKDDVLLEPEFDTFDEAWQYAQLVAATGALDE